jgi:hypothetical protein
MWLDALVLLLVLELANTIASALTVVAFCTASKPRLQQKHWQWSSTTEYT